MEKGPSNITRFPVERTKPQRPPEKKVSAPPEKKRPEPQSAPTANAVEKVVQISGARKGLETLASGNVPTPETPPKAQQPPEAQQPAQAAETHKEAEAPKTPADIYANMLHSAHETGTLKIQAGGDVLTPGETNQILENEYAQATLEFATKYPQEAQEMAKTNPRMKEALDLIKNNAEQKQSPKSRENLALRKEVSELKDQVAKLTAELSSLKALTLEVNTNMAKAMQETDPSKKKLLLEIIFDLLKHLVFSATIETPLDLAKEAAGQSQQQLKAA